jgi:acyl dehydratase
MKAMLALADLGARVGQEVAVSDWFPVTQAVIDEFAEATRDAQWIHVDTERALLESPFRDSDGRRCTVAHGFLALALLPVMIADCVRIVGASSGANIGFDKVRFVNPVPAGSRLRGHFTLRRVDPVAGGVQIVWNVTLERAGDSRPALTAEWLTRVLE